MGRRTGRRNEKDIQHSHNNFHPEVTPTEHVGTERRQAAPTRRGLPLCVGSVHEFTAKRICQ